MFALLTETILAQGASGSFSDAGTLQSVEATSDGSTSSRGTSSNVGLPVGVVVAGLVAVAAGLGYYFYQKKRSLIVSGGPESASNNKHDVTDDSSNEGERKQ